MESSEEGPVAKRMREKILEEFAPISLDIKNESHLHAHHAAMKGNTNKETHFNIQIVSDKFANEALMKRHRMIHRVLAEELSRENGVHALTLKTKTPAEVEREATEALKQASLT